MVVAAVPEMLSLRIVQCGPLFFSDGAKVTVIGSFLGPFGI